MRFRINGFGVLACMALFTIIFLFWSRNPGDVKRIEAENAKINQEWAIKYSQNLGKSMQYFKDLRVGNCYGFYSYIAEGYKHHSITRVECTPEVEELIKQGVK